MSDSNQGSNPPPHSLDAERAALGAVLLEPRALAILQDTVKDTDFYSPAHRIIYGALSQLADENVPIDLTTLADRLRRNNQLDSIGGPTYLASLEDFVFTTENVAQYAQTIVDASQLRKLIEASDEIRRRAYESPLPVGDILDLSEKQIFDLTQQIESRDFLHVDQLASDTIDTITQRFHKRLSVSGLPTGYVHLDRMLTGLQKTDLIILAARPSIGKTAFALNIATNIILGNPSAPVGFFSLEMSSQQVVQRILCSMARVSMQNVRQGTLTRVDLEKLDERGRRLSTAPLYIDDTPNLSIIEVRAKARRLKAKVKDLGLIILDYLQLMRGHTKLENRQQEVSEISRSLKGLARELEIPIVALSQLSRSIEQRKKNEQEPKLSDLRESGAIEQDADVVMFVHRQRIMEEAGHDNGQRNPLASVQPAQIIIGKQRNGPVGKVDLLFFPDYTRFEPMLTEAID